MAAVVSIIDRRRVAIPDGRVRFRMFPRSRGRGAHEQWLYAMGCTDGTTKIGVSSNPAARILSHWVNSAGGITWVHVFRKLRHAYPVERRACVIAAGLGERIRRTERFRNLSRDDALASVRQAIAEHAKAA